MTTERSTLAVRVQGSLSDEQLGALRGLLEAELSRLKVSLELESDAGAVGAWVQLARQNPALLVIVVLDVRQPEAWQLYVVDAARGRAIKRELPGGLESNAAAFEAVASVLVSATAALQEGLEVASRPLEEVVEGATTQSISTAAKRQAELSPNAETTPNAHLVVTPAERPLRLVAEIGAGGSTLASGHPPSLDLGARFGLLLSGRLTLRARSSWSLPATFSTRLGEFRVARRALGLSVGAPARAGAFTLEPELGVTGEVLRRTDVSPLAGVSAGDDRSSVRFGPTLHARLSYALGPLIGLQFSAGAAYFPRKIRFVALAPQAYALASLSPLSFGLELGLVLRAPR